MNIIEMTSDKAKLVKVVAQSIVDKTKKLPETGLDSILNILKDKVINSYVSDIGKINKISYIDKKLNMKISLKDLEEHEIDVTCNSIYISEDGSKMIFGEFSSTKTFAQNILNKFAASTYDIPDKTGVHLAMRCARTVLGLNDSNLKSQDTIVESDEEETNTGNYVNMYREITSENFRTFPK